MRPRAMAVLGIAAFLFFLIARIPASFVAARVAAEAPQVEIFDASGTLWNGQARARIATPGGPFLVDHVEWHCLPGAIAAGKLAFDVSLAGGGADARAEIGRGVSTWHVNGLIAHAKAGIAATLFPLAGTWRPEGNVEISSDSLAWNGRELRGTLNLDWKDAIVALSEVRPLGTYRLEIRGEGESAPVKVTTATGALRVAGQGKLTLPSRFTFSGEARGEGASAKALDPLLDLMGPRRPDGARSLEIRR
jgi:general secretion pathway protein N